MRGARRPELDSVRTSASEPAYNGEAMRRSAIPALLLIAALAVVAAGAAAQSSADAGRPGRWFGADGRPLPFATDEEVLAFLRTAEPVASEPISGSLNRPMLVTLEQGGVRARAIFRTVDVDSQRDQLATTPEHARGFRDFYLYEVAAYELSRLVGIDNVPPAAERTIGREKGSVQLWVEQAMGVADRLEQGIDPQHEKLWLFQKQNMVVFDNLIYNFDRNPGNMLIDVRGKVWFVDHTRAFKFLPSLPHRKDIQVCERKLYEGLRDLDAGAVREKLGPYLKTTEIDALLKRQQKLVKEIDKRISRHGEQAILFEFVSG